MHDMKNTQKDSQNSTQETARTSSTESESIDQYIVASESNPTGIMEFHRPAVSRGCIRQATFPNATPQTQMITYPPRQLSLPANPNADVNGLGQKPLTTSQHHPPKITLLNRSPALNLSSPTPTDSSSQPSSAEDLSRVTSIPSFSDESLTGMPSKPSAEEDDALSSARPPLSTDSSFDYKDSSGIDLHEFIVKTLRENPRDRLMLLKLEKDFINFIKDDTRIVHKYQQMTSYHRMLVHRVAAYFGLDHNVDSTGKCVMVNKNASTRIPECSFQMYCSREYSDEELSQYPRAILKRANSVEDCATPPRPRSPQSTSKSLEDKKSRSIEEREHDYEKARARIFQDSVSSQSSIDSADLAPSGTSAPVSSSATDVALEANRQSNIAPRFQDWNEQRNAEREAAIAAAAAATGNKGGNLKLKKRWPKYEQGRHESPQRPDMVQTHGMTPMPPMMTPEMQMMSNPAMAGAGVPGSAQGVYINVGQDGFSPGSMWINPTAGQPVAGHDASQVIYQPGYSASRPGGVVYQSQQMPSHAAQQAHYPYMMPVQYSGGGPQQHYYVVHQPQGDRSAMQPMQTNTASMPGPAQQAQLGYQEVAGQMAALSLSHRHHENADEDSASTDSYSTTPTPPPHSQMDMQHQVMVPGSPYVLVPHRQMVPGQMYQSPMPLQYIPGQGYVPYPPYAQYVTMQEPGTRYPQSQTPPVQARSPSPVMVGAQYVGNHPHHVPTHINRSAPGQTPPYTRTPPPTSAPYICNTMQGPVPGSTMIFPVPQSLSAQAGGAVPPGSVTPPATSGPYSSWKAQKRGPKGTNGMSHDILHYQALAQEGHRVQQNIASMSAQTRQPMVKMIHVPPHLPVMTGQRFPQPPAAYNQFVGYSPVYKRSKPRVQNRTPRQSANSSTADDDKKTVSHILEVYDMPEGLSSSENEALLKDVEDAGGRILQINNSSIGSSQTPVGPRVLAIFKSATDAQNALETINSPKFKLRVSQKSPTHFAADNSGTSPRSSSTSSS
ncbi:cAMP-regulated phosphoprotein 21-like isoform X3 [Rhopilema esculentum]|uniref:cAMP-regulated phosphoprotein 21-like isoform X3 n=1 Tax=Rhopilema esculentum TaxID=499914 RepID=UPI0031D57049